MDGRWTNMVNEWEPNWRSRKFRRQRARQKDDIVRTVSWLKITIDGDKWRNLGETYAHNGHSIRQCSIYFKQIK